MIEMVERGAVEVISSDRVTLSRNETESLCMKAARGSGFSWGMAEEAGFATGWLCAQGIDGATPLLALLTRKLDRSAQTGAPRVADGQWHSIDHAPLCPIQLGAALTDRAATSGGPFRQETRLAPVRTPLLLLPFLVRVAQICQKSLAIDWNGGCLNIPREGIFDGLDTLVWAGQNTLAMKITMSSVEDGKSVAAVQANLPLIPVSTVNGLGALALRTTVPATNASRSGAGSTTTDND
jgi:hypothetical protein